MDDILRHIFALRFVGNGADRPSLCRCRALLLPGPRHAGPTFVSQVLTQSSGRSIEERGKQVVPPVASIYRSFTQMTSPSPCLPPCLLLCSAYTTTLRTNGHELVRHFPRLDGRGGFGADDGKGRERGTIQLSAAIGAGASPSRARARSPAANVNDYIGCVE